MLGLQPIVGLLAFTMSAGAVMGALGQRLRGRDVTIGLVMAWSLGLGLLFTALYKGSASRAIGILFGQVFGITGQEVAVTSTAPRKAHCQDLACGSSGESLTRDVRSFPSSLALLEGRRFAQDDKKNTHGANEQSAVSRIARRRSGQSVLIRATRTGTRERSRRHTEDGRFRR